MAKPRVILTRRWPEEVERKLAAAFAVEFNGDDRALSESELKDALQRADAVLPTVSDRLTARLLEVEPLRTRILGNFGVGYNHIDLEAARARGIVVTNTPGVLTDCTADLTLTLLLMVARRAGEGERELRAGRWRGWRPTHLLGTRVAGKTLGLIGMGRIGRAVARRAHHGFGMRVLAYNRSPLAAEELAALGAEPCASLEELLVQSDFVSLHCPGGQGPVLDAARLALMKPSAFLINTARGDVVDEAALSEALQRRAIAGAGLDVYAAEPRVPEALMRLDNVVLLPHLGSATHETRVAMGMRVLHNLEAFFAGRTPPDRVA
ncbi:MAG TPA: D-glycerate dehydrogenase [Nevskiales bacterium]|nr:D-glycerate dehydrogenase [Nevskiales bacterium]